VVQIWGDEDIREMLPVNVSKKDGCGESSRAFKKRKMTTVCAGFFWSQLLAASP
jgi:hypothetical protein